MKKLIILLVSLLIISLNSFAPPEPSWRIPLNDNIYKLYGKHCLINENLVSLKNGTKKTRKEVFNLIQPLLNMYLEEYKDNYIIADSLSYALACIFVSESSNGKGHSGRSSLWLKYNNPFGMTTGMIGNTVTKMSWEMIEGERINMYRTFKTYNSLEEAVESLLWDYLLKERYESLRTTKTVKEFLYSLYKCGYMTNKFWPQFAYNEIYLKSI